MTRGSPRELPNNFSAVYDLADFIYWNSLVNQTTPETIDYIDHFTRGGAYRFEIISAPIRVSNR